jgi:CBS domain-containing protein
MRIGELCTREVVYCERTTGAVEVAQLMRSHHVGDLVVVDRRNGRLRPVGIVTDRDLVVEVLARRVDPESVTAGDLMSAALVTAKQSEPVHDAIERMRARVPDIAI